MVKLITISFKLPSLNEIIQRAKQSRYKYAKSKSYYTDAIALIAKTVKPIPETPTDFVFIWYCKNKRTDPDNISSGQKFVFDGLMKGGVIKNDGWRQVNSITHEFFPSESNYLEVYIKQLRL